MKDDNRRDDLSSMQWDCHPSILEFIQAHIIHDKPGVTEDGYTLPDDEQVSKGSKIRWAAGAMDGVMTHHMGTGQNDESVRKTVELVVAYSRQPTVRNKAAVYQHIIADQIVSIIDPVIEALLNEKNIGHDRLYELAHSFVTEAPDREPVKFGIAILGLFRRPDDQELFQILGRHDEFTLYCAVAITNSTEDHEEALWALARNVIGWGRIQVVERLARTANPEIKAWLLREGFRNSVMYEYLAATCARAGDLLAALTEDAVDRELLTSAVQMIQAMIAGGPAEGIDNYEDARPVIEAYLEHMTLQADTVQDFLNVNSIKCYLDEDDSHWESRLASGWSAECRNALRTLCSSILGRAEWTERVRVKLRSEDEMEFAHADQAAKALGIDTWDMHWGRLQQNSADPGRWFHVMALCNENRIGKVMELAAAKIDLDRIGTGAADELGLGPGFEQHGCLDFVLQELRRFPNRGAKLIEAGLKSPVVRNRNMAVNALAGWPRNALSGGIEMSLQRAFRIEPDKGLKKRMQQVLKGEPLST